MFLIAGKLFNEGADFADLGRSFAEQGLGGGTGVLDFFEEVGVRRFRAERFLEHRLDLSGLGGLGLLYGLESWFGFGAGFDGVAP